MATARLSEEHRKKIADQQLFNRREGELDEALVAKQNPTVEQQLEYYKRKAKRESQLRYEAELELARVQRKSRRHRENIRGMQRALRIAQLEKQVADYAYNSLFRIKKGDNAVLQIEEERIKAAQEARRQS